MTVGAEPVARACAELSAGEEIEAWHNGRIFHRGRVTDMVPDLGLFWIMDPLTDGRKLLDMAEFEIIRVTESPSPRAQNRSQRLREHHASQPPDHAPYM